MRKTLTNVACYYCGVEWVVIQYLLTQARFPAKRNATDSVRKVRKKRNKRKKITQSKTLRKTPFPSKRNARNCQPIEMVDLNSQSSKQPIKCLRCLRFSFTQRTQRNRLRCVRCVWWKPGLRHAMAVMLVWSQFLYTHEMRSASRHQLSDDLYEHNRQRLWSFDEDSRREKCMRKKVTKTAVDNCREEQLVVDWID